MSQRKNWKRFVDVRFRYSATGSQGGLLQMSASHLPAGSLMGDLSAGRFAMQGAPSRGTEVAKWSGFQVWM